jgi:hypothetical protein
MMAPTGAAALVERWAHYYGDRKMVSAAVTYVHLAGILLGGGLSVASDRASLQLKPDSGPDVQRDLARLYTVHRWVITGLAFTVTTGLLMLFADLHTFITSPLYWTKMGLVALLLTNGYVRLRAENGLRQGRAAWSTFRRTSAASLALWFLVLLAGAFLTTIS